MILECTVAAQNGSTIQFVLALTHKLLLECWQKKEPAMRCTFKDVQKRKRHGRFAKAIPIARKLAKEQVDGPIYTPLATDWTHQVLSTG